MVSIKGQVAFTLWVRAGDHHFAGDWGKKGNLKMVFITVQWGLETVGYDGVV